MRQNKIKNETKISESNKKCIRINLVRDKGFEPERLHKQILSPDGSTYEYDDISNGAVSKPIDVADVTPGNMRRGKIAFKVPSSITGLQFVLS